MRPVCRTCLAAVVTVLVLGGCLEREERITVSPDGTVHVKVHHESKSRNELYEVDAAPSLEGGWFVEETSAIHDDGDERFRLDAEMVFGPDAVLPTNYAALNDKRADVFLQFPTTLEIEQRSDGLYYHFHRRYVGRKWAGLEILRKKLLDGPLEEFEDRDFEELTRTEKISIMRAFADFEVGKMIHFARRSFLDVSPDLPQDFWLRVHASVSQIKLKIDYDEMLELMLIEDDAERDEALQLEADRWEDAARLRLRQALEEHAGYGGGRMRAFLDRYDWHLQYHDVSQDLGDDNFKITVVMPGEIIGHNGERTGNEITWNFTGEEIRDRDVELMVTSYIAE